MLIGHQKAWQYFENAVNSGRLAHAYILAGPPQIGKRTLANLVAAKLIGVAPEKLSASPDYYYVERTVNEKTGKLRKDIIVEQARALRQRFSQRAWGEGWQVATLDEAELINEEAGNALLKILEEPPVKTVIFLLTESENSLLATIRSRAQIIYLRSVAKSEIVKGLIEKGAKTKEAEEIADFAWGRPGRALELCGNKELLNACRAEVDRWQNLACRPFYEKIKSIEGLFGEDKEDHIRSRDRLGETLELWQMAARAELVKSGSKKIAGQIDALSRARELLKQNIHPRLLVETAVIQL